MRAGQAIFRLNDKRSLLELRQVFGRLARHAFRDRFEDPGFRNAPEIARSGWLPPLRHVEVERAGELIGVNEPARLCVFARPGNRIDGSPGAMGEKIQPNRCVLAQEPSPQIFCRVGKPLPPRLIPLSKCCSSRSFVDPVGACAQVDAVGADGKGAVRSVLVEERQRQGVHNRRERHLRVPGKDCAQSGSSLSR